jgi:hypothetical protein
MNPIQSLGSSYPYSELACNDRPAQEQPQTPTNAVALPHHAVQQNYDTKITGYLAL